MSSELTTESFRITAVTKLRHTVLLDAARKLGSQRALAEHLGVHHQTVCKWITLSTMPVRRPSGGVGRWSKERVDELERRLLALTGQTLDELFPPALARNRAFLDSSKLSEVTREFEHSGLLQYAASTTERLSSEQDGEALREHLQLVLGRLPERERAIVTERFGIGGEPKTLETVGKQFDITKERVRQICSRAISKLQVQEESTDD